MEYNPFIGKIRFNKNESKEKTDRFELKIDNNDELCACVYLDYKDDSIAIINSSIY